MKVIYEENYLEQLEGLDTEEFLKHLFFDKDPRINIIKSYACSKLMPYIHADISNIEEYLFTICQLSLDDDNNVHVVSQKMFKMFTGMDLDTFVSEIQQYPKWVPEVLEEWNTMTKSFYGDESKTDSCDKRSVRMNDFTVYRDPNPTGDSIDHEKTINPISENS